MDVTDHERERERERRTPPIQASPNASHAVLPQEKDFYKRYQCILLSSPFIRSTKFLTNVYIDSAPMTKLVITAADGMCLQVTFRSIGNTYTHHMVCLLLNVDEGFLTLTCLEAVLVPPAVYEM